MRKAIVIAGAALVMAARSATAQCGGVERWAVKMAADQGAALIDVTPVSTAFVDLIHITRPTLPGDDITRVPAERTVRVVDGRLVQFKLESGKTGDADYHLVISDDTQLFSAGGPGAASPHSVIAEIVDPDCVAGRAGSVIGPSRFATQLTAVRAKFLLQFPSVHSAWNQAGGIPVRVTGVVFFDRPHGQVGRALNGLELHPVLDIQFNPSPGAPPPGAPPAVTTTTVALANPGFEQGSVGWTATADVIHTGNDEQPHSGDRLAWLGGYGSAHVDKLSQEVALPGSVSAIALSFFLHVSTEEPTTGIADRLRVRVRDHSGALLSTLGVFSNLDAADGFQLRTFDLTPYRGRTVRISLEAVENGSNVTSFIVDDFSLVIQP